MAVLHILGLQIEKHVNDVSIVNCSKIIAALVRGVIFFVPAPAIPIPYHIAGRFVGTFRTTSGAADVGPSVSLKHLESYVAEALGAQSSGHLLLK
jgi:hypothetical protein